MEPWEEPHLLMGTDQKGHKWQVDLAFDRGLTLSRFTLDGRPMDLTLHVIGPRPVPPWHHSGSAEPLPSLMETIWQPGIGGGKLFAHCDTSNLAGSWSESWSQSHPPRLHAYFELYISSKGLCINLSYQCETQALLGWAFSDYTSSWTFQGTPFLQQADKDPHFSYSSIASLPGAITLLPENNELVALCEQARLIAHSASGELSFGWYPSYSKQGIVVSSRDPATPILNASALELVIEAVD